MALGVIADPAHLAGEHSTPAELGWRSATEPGGAPEAVARRRRAEPGRGAHCSGALVARAAAPSPPARRRGFAAGAASQRTRVKSTRNGEQQPGLVTCRVLTRRTLNFSSKTYLNIRMELFLLESHLSSPWCVLLKTRFQK